MGRIASEGERTCRWRSSRRGGSLERVIGLGARNIVFSTLALTVQTCVTMQRRAASACMFGSKKLITRRAGLSGMQAHASHVGSSSFSMSL